MPVDQLLSTRTTLVHHSQGDPVRLDDDWRKAEDYKRPPLQNDLRSLLPEAKPTSDKLHITLSTDSSSGKSIAARTGPGKRTRHVELRYFWVQELTAKGLIRLKKIPGTDNPADLLTK